MAVVSACQIRDLLLPGLREMYSDYSLIQVQWDTRLFRPSAPHIWIPKLSLPAAIAVGAAATIIKNPILTRRFWQGWTQ